MEPIDVILERTLVVRNRLIKHPIYEAIRGPESLCRFLEHHVFAVWDFMTLLKALQRELTCVELPWVPKGDREARRLINEIVLAEESDEDGQGGHASHFEIYLEAMTQAGADTRPIERFLMHLGQGMPIDQALEACDAPESARAFVMTTWQFVESRSTAAIASAFTIGRENLIPDLFRGIVTRLESQEPDRLSLLRHYLDRHVELDQDEHGPMAFRMLASVCGDKRACWQDARYAAEVALEARLALWDAMFEEIAAVSSDRA